MAEGQSLGSSQTLIKCIAASDKTIYDATHEDKAKDNVQQGLINSCAEKNNSLKSIGFVKHYNGFRATEIRCLQMRPIVIV